MAVELSFLGAITENQTTHCVARLQYLRDQGMFQSRATIACENPPKEPCFQIAKNGDRIVNVRMDRFSRGGGGSKGFIKAVSVDGFTCKCVMTAFGGGRFGVTLTVTFEDFETLLEIERERYDY